MDTANQTTQETARARAEELLEARLSVIDELLKALQDRDSAQAALEGAQRALSGAVRAAEDAGWTSNELRQIGVPVAQRKGRSSRPRRRSSHPAASPAADRPESDGAP